MSFVPNIIEEAVRDRFLFEESPPQCNKMQKEKGNQVYI